MHERKSYTKSFKAQVVHECEQPGVSVAAIAMSHGINANVVRRWPKASARSPFTLKSRKLVPVSVDIAGA